ncbi:hypothetical protein [Nonomuraea sp. SBT364]|uniref:hypothetical protein n=1 Tax=Nonomuraea sp. SBT364 TaxID=1580530 RepID=UPI00066C26FC|nr:hypothetical protein [Nonomuraea sp. SBT364]
METDLRRTASNGSAVHTAEFIVSSARLGELFECSALLRRTRQRAEQIVEEAGELLAEALREGDTGRAQRLGEQLEEARRSYAKVLNAYMILSRRISDERQEILQAQIERDRHADLSGAA